MSDSIIKFAKDFQRLKSIVASEHTHDSKLIRLVAFWKVLKNYKENPFYQTYFDEYIPHLIKSVTDADLSDLTINELSEIKNTLKELPENHNPRILECIKKIVIELVQNFFYVGEIRKAFEHLTDIIDQSEIEKLDLSVISNQNEFESFRQIVEQAQTKSQVLYQLLLPILIEWEKVIESVDNEGACCLYVEKDSAGNSIRGRMQILYGNIEVTSRSNNTDDIAFDNKVITPDDPFIGVSYSALKAVRKKFNISNSVMNKTGNAPYHAHFEIKDSSQTFTGDSIGLAVALLSYTNLLKTEISRQDKFLAADVAITGSIDEDGHILPVDDKTLSVKIRRAFFSPVKYLAIPERNAEIAKICLNDLNSEYPNRRLLIIAGSHLNDILEDHNIIRSERVCLGNFVTRKVIRYSRATKIQVPLLMGLLWLFSAFLFPEYFNPWFDWHIAKIEVKGNRFKTINFEGQELWLSEEFDAELKPEWYDNEKATGQKLYWAIDIDNNGRDELFITSCTPKVAGMLRFYSDKGKLSWQKPCFKKTSYPGDTQYNDIPANMHYGIWEIIPIIDKDSNIFIMTSAEWSPPVRHQFLLYDTAGNLVSGPYLHTGATWPGTTVLMSNNLDGDPVVFLGATNNRLNRAALFVLNPKNLSGISPPYDDEFFLASNMSEGSQLYYVTFPETELSKGIDVRNYCTGIVLDSVTQTYHTLVIEGSGAIIDEDVVQYDLLKLPGICYRLDKNFIPLTSYFPDRHVKKFNSLLLKTRDQLITKPNRVLDSLRSEVVVYHGDSIVNYPSLGIYYYQK